MRSATASDMTWAGASIRAVAVVVYFIVALVWLPNTILELGAVADASALIRDLLVSAVWGAALVALLFGLHSAQRRGLI